MIISIITIIIICMILYLIAYYFNLFNMYILDSKNRINVKIFNKIDRNFNLMFPNLYLDPPDIILIILIILGICQTYNSDLNPFYKIIISIVLIMIPIILVFPAIHLYNSLLSTMTSNLPINLNKEKYFEYHKVLEETHNFEKIRKEVSELLKKNNIDCFSKYHSTDLDNNSIEKCWKWFPLLDHKSWHKENCKSLPYLSKLLSGNSNIVSASISIIEPGMKIPPHRGYMKSVLRYHLGIIIPKDKKPFITVDNQKYYWKEGEGIMFDDMYIHYVENPSGYRRAVLFIDVLRNDIPYVLDRVNRWMYSIIVSNSLLRSYDSSIHNQELLTKEEIEAEVKYQNKLK